MHKEKKHAYLIMAHKNFYVLEKLLLLLDDYRNDIYIHIDKKTDDFDDSHFANLLKKSNISFLERKNVFWAEYSQVDVTLSLLKAAMAHGEYHYYHLLSGADLPLKSQDYIHDFLKDKDHEFIGIVPQTSWYSTRRVKYYFPFLNTTYYRKYKLLKAFVCLLVLIQRVLRFDRLKKYDLKIYNGWTWFSISNSFAKYLVDNKQIIEKLFQKTLAADEMFVQTMAYNSHFKEKIYDMADLKTGSMRYIDWKRGTPYVFRTTDFEALLGSKYLFARKFDKNLDQHIVDRIYDRLKKYD